MNIYIFKVNNGNEKKRNPTNFFDKILTIFNVSFRLKSVGRDSRKNFNSLTNIMPFYLFKATRRNCLTKL